MYKLEVYVPDDYVEAVKRALFDAGAGRIGHYDSCCWQTKGSGQFRALDGAKPFVGDINAVCQESEAKLELVCAEDKIKAAVQALLSAHPYEEPAYQVIAVVDPASLPEG